MQKSETFRLLFQTRFAVVLLLFNCSNLFAAMSNSRINSWETWFIFTCQTWAHQSHARHTILRFSMNHEHHNFFLYTFIHTWAAIPCSTSRICPSWPCPRVRLSPLLSHTYLVSNLFFMAYPAACCLFQQPIFHTCNPPLTTRRYNTFIQEKHHGCTLRHIQQTCTQFTTFLLMPPHDHWAGWLAPNFHVGNITHTANFSLILICCLVFNLVNHLSDGKLTFHIRTVCYTEDQVGVKAYCRGPSVLSFLEYCLTYQVEELLVRRSLLMLVVDVFF